MPGRQIDDEDNVLDFVFPQTPSGVRQMPDSELAGLWRKLAHANRYPHDRMVEQEFQFRLIAALGEFKRAADRSSRVLIWLTLVLVVLTAAIVWLTYQLE